MSNESPRDPRSMEDRLRAAYEARAELVDPADVAAVPRAADERAAGRSRRPVTALFGPRPWLGPALAAACVIALVIGIAVALTGNGHRQQTSLPTPSTTAASPTPTTSSPTSPKPSTTSTPPAAPTMLGLGQVGTRDQIPWSLVGDGWTVALWSATSPDRANHPDAVLQQTLFLVDPQGGRYRITSFSDTQMYVADVSGDHQRALVGVLSATTTRRSEVDLHTGHVTAVTIPSGVDVEYTKPLGKALLAFSTTVLERLNFDGSVQHVFFPGAGMTGSTPYRALYSADGATLVIGNAHGLTVVGNDGSNPHLVPEPTATTLGCAPTRWWEPGVVLARCAALVKGQPGMDQLWLIPIDGGTPIALTAHGDVHTAGGDGNAWQMHSGTFVAGEVGCGGGFIPLMLNPDGTTREVTIIVPGASSGGPVLSGVTADWVFARINVSCQGVHAAALVRFDPGTGTSIVLFGANVGGGAVISSKTISSLG